MIIDLAKNTQSHVMPMLVDLYNAQHIEALAHDEDHTSRSELISIVTSLLAMELSPRESELVADVLICLMRQVQRDVCVALSEKLAELDNVPLRLVMHIANESIDIARPILRKSPIFNDMDLIYIIKSKSAEYWREIARRSRLGGFVAMELAKTDDLETALNLVANTDTALEHDVLELLSHQARTHENLAKVLLHRPELTPDIVRTLYHGVGVALKHYIRQEFEAFADQGHRAVDDVVLDLSVPDIHIPHSKPFTLQGEGSDVDQMRGIRVSTFVHYLEKGMYKEFLDGFSTYTNISTDNLSSIIAQESGQGLAIICKALKIERRDFVALYLLMNRMRHNGGMVDPKHLKRATRYFDQIGRDAADTILERVRCGEKLF